MKPPPLPTKPASFVGRSENSPRDVAQVVARSVRDAEVAGSSPVIPTSTKKEPMALFL